MKKIWKELLILILQFFTFYIVPLYSASIDAIALVLLLIIITFILAVVFACISSEKWKYFYPIIISMLFIPSVFIYYNISALIHTIWYLVVSALGILIGIIFKSANKSKLKD